MPSQTFSNHGDSGIPSLGNRSGPWTSSCLANVLLIEDDLEAAEAIVGDLARRGYKVTHAADGIEGLDKAGNAGFDLLIIDRTLPGLDGLAIIAALRREENHTPILVLSGLGEVDERVRGLSAGGDDYLSKPFDFEELAARSEALLRRHKSERRTILQAGPLELDLINRQAWRGRRPIELLPREFKLLEYLMRRAGQTVTRAML
ncbi:MAG TPA: response regulator transcription factor, partial [Patescibacteria group bacterium]|nr:response regulator transcription factor [Patescibacteria group bacterium]